ncbi:uncharacterized protein LOC110812641 [Carica papaya]|uniref:uncharacterized protein LOC110812641 n=1 Tax=Carica papaya TaxID=3649 RepID=UPI000B8CFA46|nr:uncharacterized protein LOC110812641 [Carica papaya]
MATQEMASTTKPTKKTASFLMNFYRFSASYKHHKPKKSGRHDPDQLTNNPTTNPSCSPAAKIKGSTMNNSEETENGCRMQRGGGGEMCGVVVVEGSRKSVSHAEANLASVATFLQVKVLVSDMPELMQVHAFRCARRTYDSLERFSSKHMAFNIKKEFDKVYGPAWHCIVGSSFGSFVTHSTGYFLYFSMEKKLCVLLFKTKVGRAV